MKVLESIAVLAVLLAVVAGQNKCHWGAPFGCPTKDKANHRSTDLKSRLPGTFQSPRDEGRSDEGINEHSKPMDAERKNEKSASKHRFEDIKAYLKNFYQ